MTESVLSPDFSTQFSNRGLLIVEVQIVKETFDVIRFNICPEIERQAGPLQVILESVLSIPRGTNGKFRAVISNLRPETMNEFRK